MRRLNVLAFDDIIAGTGQTWYSPTSLNSELGACDMFGVHAFTTAVSGTTPSLVLQFEHSTDNQNWRTMSATPLYSGAISNEASAYGYIGINNTTIAPGAFVRMAVSLSGTNPQCRLKLYITGRAAA